MASYRRLSFSGTGAIVHYVFPGWINEDLLFKLPFIICSEKSISDFSMQSTPDFASITTSLWIY